MRILIAEDDATSRTILQAVLGKGGYEVVSRADGLEALEAFKQSDAPDLAIVDLIMPKLDGLELVREVRALPTPRPPYIIILSTKSETTDVVAGLDAGADDYLVKPFDAAELRARVEVGRRMLEMRAVLADKVQELALALDQVKTLRGIVPICANCKNVRDDQGYWNRVETYMRDHTGAEFSHAVCPDCMDKLYPQLQEKRRRSQALAVRSLPSALLLRDQDLVVTLEEHVDDFRVELRAAALAQDRERDVVRVGRLVRALARHRVERVGDGADPAPQRNRLAGEAGGIAGAIPSLVVAERDDAPRLQQLRARVGENRCRRSSACSRITSHSGGSRCVGLRRITSGTAILPRSCMRLAC